MITRRQVVRLAITLPFAATAVRAAAQDAPHFYVVGFVKQPGSYLLKDKMTVAEGIDAAGGVSNEGTLSGLQVVRIVNGEKTSADVTSTEAIQKNDTIRVRRR